MILLCPSLLWEGGNLALSAAWALLSPMQESFDGEGFGLCCWISSFVLLMWWGPQGCTGGGKGIPAEYSNPAPPHLRGCSHPSHCPCQIGKGLWCPFGGSSCPAGVKHIGVINVTKNNLELPNLIPGMVWEMQFLRSAWVFSILKCYWSLTFPNQFFPYTKGIKWSEPLHYAILEKFFLNHCHFGSFHSSFLNLKQRGM